LDDRENKRVTDPTSSVTFTDARRVLNAWTSHCERQALVWMAQRAPRWIHSDHLTSLAAVAMVGAALAYAAARWWPPALHLVNVCLLINWFGDSLDGTLARVRLQQRPRYGFYVDHVIDCAGMGLLVIGMAASSLMSPLVALGFLVAYFLVSIEIFLATYCLATFRMSFGGIGPTELRVLLAIGNLVALYKPTVVLLGERLLLFDVGGTIAIVGLLAIFVTSAIANGRALFRAEPRASHVP
jgi:archaetidylinositol phosphate synthase